ncbi:hypothetical protein YB2330_002313 [Saitoella coloradoensis]
MTTTITNDRPVLTPINVLATIAVPKPYSLPPTPPASPSKDRHLRQVLPRLSFSHGAAGEITPPTSPTKSYSERRVLLFLKTERKSVKYRSADITLDFLLPRAGVVNVAPRKYTAPHMLEKHHAYVSASDFTHDAAKPATECKSCKAHLGAIQLAFPAIPDDNTVLACAAWLFVLCKVDDLLETDEEVVDVGEIVRASLEVLKVKKSLEEALAEAMQELVFLAPRARAESNASTISGASSIFSPPMSRSSSMDMSAYAESEASEVDGTVLPRVLHILNQMKRHLEDLLPETCLPRVFEALRHVFEGFILENNFRNMKNEWRTVMEYTEIRARTIGVAPFFAMLEAGYGVVEQSDVDKLARLRGFLTTLVGFQNDLVGLEKDVEVKEGMNLLFVRHRKNVDTVAQLNEDVDGTVHEHNGTVERVVREWEGLMNGDVTEGVQNMANCLVGFVKGHLIWATTAKRYQVE